jgi:hypothetical protein
MALIHTRFQRLIVLILLFLTCACGAQRRNYDKRLPFTIPRGGDIELLGEISDTIHDSVMDVAIGPWIQKHTVVIIKVRVMARMWARRQALFYNSTIQYYTHHCSHTLLTHRRLYLHSL